MAVSVTVVLTVIAAPTVTRPSLAMDTSAELDDQTAATALLLPSAYRAVAVSTSELPAPMVVGPAMVRLVSAGASTVSVADWPLQLITAEPATRPALTTVPLTVATAMLLLLQVPSAAPTGTTDSVAVAPVAMDAGESRMPVSSGAVTVSVVLIPLQVMVANPATFPDMTVDPFSVAMAVLLLLHVPSPADAGTGDKVAVPPVVTDVGDRFSPVKLGATTVSVVLTVPQVMVTTPAALPAVTIVPLMVANEMLLLVQVPSTALEGTGESVAVPPVEMDEGERFSPVKFAAVTVSTALMPLQVMVTVPAKPPAMTVVPFKRAIAVLLLLHVPKLALAGRGDSVAVAPVAIDDDEKLKPVRVGAT